MAKGHDRHQARLTEVQRFGKDVARRAGRRCEWCEDREDLVTHDLAPDEEPDLDTLALLCGRCRAVIGGRKDDPRTLRFLEGAVWGEHELLRQLAIDTLQTVDADWARSMLVTLRELEES